MGAQVRTGKQSFTKITGATPRVTEPQKIERKRINIVVKVVQSVIFGKSFVIGVHNFSTNVNFDLTNALNSKW